MQRKWKKLIFIAPFAIAGLLLFVALGGEIVKQLWNWLVPPLLGFHPLTFWQALGILALCRILFGGFGWRGSSHRSSRGPLLDRFADRMAERVNAMTPEEKERFRQRMRERCGWASPADESKGS